MNPWNAIKLFFRSVADFFRDGGPMLAAALSFFMIMALVPFFLFLLAIFAHLLGVNEAFFNFIVAKLVNFFPTAAQSIARELRDLITYRGMGALNFILYGLVSYQLYTSLENAINVVFKVRDKRSFLSHLFISTFLFALLLLLLITSFAASSYVSVINHLGYQFPGLSMPAITAFVIRYLVPFVLVFVTLALLYAILPKKHVHIPNALKGALVTSVLLEIAKHFFTVYVVKVAKLGAIYGPLAAFIIFLLWVFYSSNLFLIGAEVVHNLEIKKGAGGAPIRKKK